MIVTANLCHLQIEATRAEAEQLAMQRIQGQFARIYATLQDLLVSLEANPAYSQQQDYEVTAMAANMRGLVVDLVVDVEATCFIAASSF